MHYRVMGEALEQAADALHCDGEAVNSDGGKGR